MSGSAAAPHLKITLPLWPFPLSCLGRHPTLSDSPPHPTSSPSRVLLHTGCVTQQVTKSWVSEVKMLRAPALSLGTEESPGTPAHKDTEVSSQGERVLSTDFMNSTTHGIHWVRPGDRTRTSWKAGLCVPLGYTCSLTPHLLTYYFLSLSV